MKIMILINYTKQWIMNKKMKKMKKEKKKKKRKKLIIKKFLKK
jgi:hypothetical protein